MQYNKLIDHTLLKQDAQPEQIIKLCEEAKEFHFMSVCVNPAYVPLAAQCLKGSDVKVCTVIGFPLGMNLTKTKVEEAELCIKEGADEIDMVINVGMLKAGHDDYVKEEIRLLKEVAGSRVLKVIIETCLLTDEAVGPEMGVKASGGVRTHEDLIAMVEAGANRIGTSNGTKII